MRYGIRLSFVFATLLTAGLAGCGGGGAGGSGPAAVIPGSPGLPSTGAAANAHVVISIPKTSASTGRVPAYVSPATQSISVAIDGGTPTVQNLSPSSPNCSSAGATYPLNCTVPVSATAGTHTLTFITYDQANAAGNQLSANSISVSFVAGQNPAIPVVLAGVPASFQANPVTAISSTPIVGSITAGYQFLMGASAKMLINALDADGNYIVGPGAPTIAASVTGATTGSGITIAPAGGGNPNLFTLASTGAGSATLALSATPAASLAGSALTATIRLSAAALVTTVAGKAGVRGLVDGTGTSAEFSSPNGDAYDSANGDIYVVDSCTVREVTPGNGSANSATVTTIAGSATCGDVDGSGTGAKLNSPSGIAYDRANDYLYIADGCEIRQVTPGNGTANSGVVTTIAGGTCGEADGTGTGAQLYYPDGIAYDAANQDLYVTDQCTIRQVTPGNGTLNSGIVTTIAGNSMMCGGSADGTGTSATFDSLWGLAVDSANGDLYVADYCSVRQVTIGNGSANSGVVTTIAGNNSTCGFADGTGTAAQFFWGLNGIAYDSTNGDLYVADESNCNLRQVTPGNGTANSGVVTTIAGGNSTQCTFADGFGSSARFNSPYFPAYDPTNNSLYVGDDTYTIRQVQL